MKKVIISFIALISLFTITGCSNPKQDALVKYINEDLPGIATIEQEVNTAYSSVNGANYTNDKAMLDKLKNVVIGKSNELVVKAEAVKSSDDKVNEAHKLYVSAVKKQHQAFTLIIEAIETNDATKITKANDLLAEARKDVASYKSAVEELKTEYKVITK